MNLLVGLYLDPNPARTEEFFECLRRNAANPGLDGITVFLEDPIAPALLLQRHPELASPRIRFVAHGRRLTFAQLFAYANAHFPDAGVIVANADIFFDESLTALEDETLAGKMLCLSRWDETDGAPRHFDRPDSQDAWIFEPPLPAIACDFPLGMPGCDNRLAFEAERAGLAVSNPSRSLQARHLHGSTVRRYTAGERLVGPIRLVPASFLKVRNAAKSAAMAQYPSRRVARVDDLAADRVREIEAALQPFFGGIVPRGLRRELRRVVRQRAAGLPPPADVPPAVVAYREAMGYTLARLQPGTSTHNNDERPLVSVPDRLAGLCFTQVVANHAAPVEVEFRTAGRLFVLAAPGWEGYAPASAFLDDAGWREPIEPLRTRGGTVFEPWSLVATAGERLTFPTQVMLAGPELIRAV